MSQYTSFEKYLEAKYYNDIHRAITGLILKRGRNNSFYSYTVLDPSYFQVDDIHVKTVSFHSTDGNRIIFNAAVEADVILKGMGKRDYDADMNNPWYTVSFTGYLSDGLNMVTINDCHDGQIDMVITKSISRFARNTVDCLNYTRALKNKNIGVYFEKENINTLDAKGEVLMTIMASLAQQESESLSANVRLGLQFRYQQGKVQVNHNWFLGYTKDEDGHLIIDQEQAEVVKRIYREFLSGSGLLKIKRSLESDGILNGAGRAKWHETNIKQILTNEKYIGDALLQKTYTVDILEKKREANKGQVPKYYVENSHEGIIPKDIFLKAQEEIARRANLTKGATQHKRVYSGRYALSGIVFCAHCGDIYRRIKWNNRGCKSTVWRCISRVDKDGPDCTARTVREEHLQEVAIEAINGAFREKETILPLLIENIESSLEENTDDRIKEVDEQIKTLQQELLATASNKNAGDELGMEIRRLRDEKQAIQAEDASRQDRKKRIDELIAFLEGLPCELTEYDEQFVKTLIEKITVFDNHFIVEFKSGIEIEINE